MDGNYTVDVDELQALTHRIDTYASLVRERVLAADAAVTRLSMGWTGPAADSFQIAHQEWVRSAEMLAEAVAEMAVSARSACKAYSAAFEGNSSMLLQGRS